MVSYSLMFCVVRSFMVFSGFGLKSPASGFQFYSSNSLKTSPTIYRVHGLEESILSKWLYYPKQSIDLMQSLSSYQQYFSQN